jgi:hypothetical protein
MRTLERLPVSWEEKPLKTLEERFQFQKKFRTWMFGSWRTSGITRDHAWNNVRKCFNDVLPSEDEIFEVIWSEKRKAWLRKDVSHN